jgi:dCTP diphosphatase
MPDASTTVHELKEAVRRFADERSWGPYHSPKNLVMALTVEVAELMEHFLWLTSDESRRAVADPARKEAIADEMADVACLLLNFSLNAGLDLSDAILAKMAKNAIKYPVGGSRPENTCEAGKS